MSKPDELDALIEELAKKISKKYGWFSETIYDGITGNKKEIRKWLKTNKKKLMSILKKL